MHLQLPSMCRCGSLSMSPPGSAFMSMRKSLGARGSIREGI
jgi:hypothetical protein